jgi:hypothetical protein
MRPFLPTEENEGQPSPASLGIRYKKTKDYGWHVPVITKCSTPFESVPDGDEILKAIETFMSMEGGVEKVADEKQDDGGRVR